MCKASTILAFDVVGIRDTFVSSHLQKEKEALEEHIGDLDI